MGGAEDVLEALVQLFPQAPVFTSIYDRRRMPSHYANWDIRSSWMDALPLIHRHHRPYLPIFPLVFEHLDLKGFDIILSNKSAFCHGVKPGHGLHVCYCLTPTRFLWGFEDYASAEGLGSATRMALRPLVARLRHWDQAVVRRVHHFVAISTVVQERIRRFYKRDSAVIHPPVDTSRFQPTTSHSDFYLSLGRLIPYKRVDLAVLACGTLGRRLKVAGAGRDRRRLEGLARTGIEFLGRVPDQDVPGLMADCRAFIFPGLEDFGIAPIQAMAAGRPVIAFAGGGALDTGVEGQTGVLFHEQTPEALRGAIEQFERMDFDPAAIRRHAEQFDAKVFCRKLRSFVKEQYAIHCQSTSSGGLELAD